MSRNTGMAEDRVNEMLNNLDKRATLEGWNAFVRELKVPDDLLPMLLTARSEVRPSPRTLTVEECRVLYDLIAGLVETNAALRMHAAETAHLVTAWQASFKASYTLAQRVERFANFSPAVVEED